MEVADNLRKKLIISADDFGLSRKANENILDLVRQGKIDRVAVLVDYSLKNEEVIELSESQVKLDVHLSLKSFDEKMEREKGILKRALLFWWHFVTEKNTLVEIEKQWTGQIERFIELFGKNPAGINSHQYIHFFPPYFRIIMRLGKKFEIPYVRFGKSTKRVTRDSRGLILNFYRKKNKVIFEKNDFETSDFLTSYDWIGNFPRFLGELPPDKTELVFHPERGTEFEIIKKYL